MKRWRCGAGFGEANDLVLVVNHNTAVLGRLGIRDERHRDERARLAVLVDEGSHVDIRQRVAIDDEERRATEQGQRAPRASRGTEYGHLPRIPDAHAFPGAVADDAGDRVREVVKIEHGLGHALRCKPLQDSLNDRPIADRKRRLGANAGQGTEAGRQTRGQHQRRNHAATPGMTLRIIPR